MSKPHEKRDLVAQFICLELKNIYYESNSKKFARKNVPVFNSKAKLIRHVLDSAHFIETAQFHRLSAIERDAVPKERICVSANTVRDAINWLLEEAYIEEKDGCLVWREKPAFDEKHAPFLQVANQIEVTVNIPEYIFFLTVPAGFTSVVTDYLSSYFHKGDILFIPMGCHIMCVSVLPSTVLSGKEEKVPPTDVPYVEQSVERVMSVLHKFKRKFPSFTYRLPYEMDALAYEDSPLKNQVLGIIKQNAGSQADIGKEYAAFQEGVSRFVAGIEQHEQAGSATPILDTMYDEDEDDREEPLGNYLSAEQLSSFEAFTYQVVASMVEQYLWEREHEMNAPETESTDES